MSCERQRTKNKSEKQVNRNDLNLHGVPNKLWLEALAKRMLASSVPRDVLSSQLLDRRYLPTYWLARSVRYTDVGLLARAAPAFVYKANA